ncbi:DUF3524 domain-containing protein [Teredinibacter sp. KSP-S5-2]|uniref:tRNA-queuosine alpha-mannosyltransferase domain-containing protein n=1 Tax=Teredinibacter sp. KSP-S5-2 TaxID=3034506 RepID=UPI002934E02D|nr:DUF3524 domain-containing protein [Teredinibacter sp. KSP-S5-2]WNO07998.1 DUF3524 domain-containing protein [Teredinibacter sp. KSP-S5-2]
MTKALLLSAYDAQSHKRWREGIVDNLPEYQWTQCVLPPRYFSWRVRGNSLTWAKMEPKLSSVSEYEFLIATSMTDLATLRGMLPDLAKLPTLLYFHENQFAYPKSAQQHPGVEPQITSIYSAICADRVAFNTGFNQQTFMQGARALLGKMPDCVPPGVVEDIENKSVILPVPIESELFCREQKSDEEFQIIWNHRWEYDKGPDRLLNGLQRIPADRNLIVHVVGQAFRRQPDEFDQIKALLSERGWLGKWGYQESLQDYRALLASSHVVLSTAVHDFQGLSVMEAAASGCLPLVPNRLAYTELFPPCCFYVSSEDKPDNEAIDLANKLDALYQAHRQGELPQLALSAKPSNYDWARLKPAYEQEIEQLISGS